MKHCSPRQRARPKSPGRERNRKAAAKAKSKEASENDNSAKEGTEEGSETKQDYSNDSREAYKFFDIKLIDMDGFRNWEEKSTYGPKNSEYRKTIVDMLDEPLPQEFSKKIDGHKTLREFFASAGLSDEEMELLGQGMIYIESNGDPKDKNSGTDARGLMQVTPIAAKEACLEQDADLFTPKQSIRGGMRYLAYSLYQTRSLDPESYDLARGVAGYHSGPNSAKGNIPKGPVATREVIVIMSLFGRLEELRGRLNHPYGDRLIDYALATPEEREALKQGMKR